MCKRVATILSTYNGEKYIEEQLKSLIGQSYNNLEIFIHDDGSVDKTVDIIKDYTNQYSNVYLLDDEPGQGYPTCFVNLLEKIEGFDYYAFSDQDDVWYPYKIADAVKTLNTVKEDKPLLYYTSVEYCDVNLTYIRASRFAKNERDVKMLPLQTLLFGGEAMGMTFVFNYKAKEALLIANKENKFKDWFLKIYCAAYGGVFYNPVPSAKYRRHVKAVTNQSNPPGKVSRYMSQFKEIFIQKDGFSTQKKVFSYLNRQCQDNILSDNKELLSLFIEPNSFGKRLRKTFWKDRFRRKLIDELGYRIAFLVGRI